MIYVSEPWLCGNEKQYLLDCLSKNELSWHGRYVKNFEGEFAKFCGVPYAISCSNGTSALHLALLALGVGPGDDVFLPALTYVATANAVRYCGANPVFCDVQRDTWCLDPESVLAAVRRSRRPKVILPVHLYGIPADVHALIEIARRYGMDLLEDAAEAPGASIEGQRVGSFGSLATFSFYANKIMTTGEGGMVVTDDPGLAERILLFRGQGQTKQFYHEVIGYNYRLTNLQAAVGLAQLETFERQAEARHRIMDWYTEYLHDSDVEFQEILPGVIPADWLCTILLPERVSRDEVAKNLLKNEIETRPIFIPLYKMPPYEGSSLVVTEELASRGLSLPTHPGLTENDVKIICISVHNYIHNKVGVM